ncbi:hypothetical protein [Desulfocurvibacter africanus]|uniref:Nuclease (SNase domain-containing protein) n=1 Tax=Desulfocurvibacter africanus subsp. africanus str. Walvis Bay TaxID=690850 RepID=F3Z2U8_DESAF|nr:hypothetical protein [Desulfocurvibacter africanus]EGJ50265.1 hypothetical protein Desaf_1936 [Desulfocurvibacter africanus subsp. africanus str. Walvis Bay]
MRLALIALILLIPSQLHAWEGRITHIIDGDSLVIEGVEVRAGLWAEGTPTEPWKWRRLHKQ